MKLYKLTDNSFINTEQVLSIDILPGELYKYKDGSLVKVNILFITGKEAMYYLDSVTDLPRLLNLFENK